MQLPLIFQRLALYRAENTHYTLKTTLWWNGILSCRLFGFGATSSLSRLCNNNLLANLNFIHSYLKSPVRGHEFILCVSGFLQAILLVDKDYFFFMLSDKVRRNHFQLHRFLQGRLWVGDTVWNSLSLQNLSSSTSKKGFTGNHKNSQRARGSFEQKRPLNWKGD